MDGSTFTLEKKAVNNKSLVNEMQTGIEDLIVGGSVIWSNDLHRQSFVDTIDDFLHLFALDGKIDQWDVTCDLRNNKIQDMDRGVYICDITFRQTNCYNRTKLKYTITDPLVSAIKDLLDFTLTP